MSRLASMGVRARTVCITLEAKGCRGAPNKAKRGETGEIVVLYAKSFKDFRPECGKLGAKQKHMGMVGSGLFAPITCVSYIGIDPQISVMNFVYNFTL